MSSFNSNLSKCDCSFMVSDRYIYIGKKLTILLDVSAKSCGVYLGWFGISV